MYHDIWKHSITKVFQYGIKNLVVICNVITNVICIKNVSIKLRYLFVV